MPPSPNAPMPLLDAAQRVPIASAPLLMRRSPSRVLSGRALTLYRSDHGRHTIALVRRTGSRQVLGEIIPEDLAALAHRADWDALRRRAQSDPGGAP